MSQNLSEQNSGEFHATPGKNQKIGTLQETSLHAALKDWYAQPGDRIEVPVDGYYIDIVRGRQLIEIQTRNFSAFKRKLIALLDQHQVHVIHPIARERWICRVTSNNEPITRRKSPKHGRFEELFVEMVRMPELVRHPNFSLEVLLTQEEVVWRDDGRGSWRRKRWSVADRRLLHVVDRMSFDSPQDYGELLPDRLVNPFTNRELAEALGLRRRIAEQMTYCLSKMDLIERVGKQGRFNLYSKS